LNNVLTISLRSWFWH